MTDDLKSWLLSLAAMLQDRIAKSEIATGQSTGLRYALLTEDEAEGIAEKAVSFAK